MRRPVFEVDFRQGSMLERQTQTLPSIINSSLRQLSIGTSLTNPSDTDGIEYAFTLTNGTYSVIGWLEHNNTVNQYFFDCRQGGGVGYSRINPAPGEWEASSGSFYVNGVATQTPAWGKPSCVVLSGVTLEATVVNLTTRSNYTNALLPGGGLAYFAIYEGTLTAQERNKLYQDFLHAGPIDFPRTLRPSTVSANTPLFVETGANFCADEVVVSAGQYLPSGWFVESGSFKVSEDTTGKYIECVTNGTIQWKAYAIDEYSPDAAIKSIRGDLAGDVMKTLGSAGSVSFGNNTISVDMVSGNKMYDLILIEDPYSERIPLPHTAGRVNWEASGAPAGSYLALEWTADGGGKEVTESGTSVSMDEDFSEAGTVWLTAPLTNGALEINDGATNAQYVGNLGVFRRLTHSLDLTNCTNVTGDLSDVSGLTHYLRLYNCSNVTGDLSDVSGLTYYLDLRLTNCSNVTGDLSDVSGLTHSLDLYNCSNVTGDLSDVSGLTHSLDLTNCTNVTGDLSDVSGLTHYLRLTNCTNVTGDLNPHADLSLCWLNGTGCSVAEISQTLINLEANTSYPGGYQWFKATPAYADLTSAAQDAVDTLVANGWTVDLDV